MTKSIWTIALICVALTACADVDEDKTAENACTDIPGCPIGTSIDLTATSSNECTGTLELGTSAIHEELKFGNGCYALGSCVYRCQPVSNCCGKEEWTVDAYSCSEPCGATACGDNVCQAGEVCQQSSCTEEQRTNGQCSLCQEDCCGVCGDDTCGINVDPATGAAYAESANASDEHYCPSDCGNQSCQAQCIDKQCGPDTCGGSCGECTAPASCNSSSQCECITTCGSNVCGPDGCGQNCGECAEGQGCSSGQCVSVVSCGNGNCDANENEDCASCPTDCGCSNAETCTVDGVCCTPNCEGKACGNDGCGGTCGTCEGLQTCSEAGQCEGCQPNCDDKLCGDDGCGGSCGTCEKTEDLWAHLNLDSSYQINGNKNVPLRAQKITAPSNGFVGEIKVPLKSDDSDSKHKLLLGLYNAGAVGGGLNDGELEALLDGEEPPDCSGWITAKGQFETAYVIVCPEPVAVKSGDYLWLVLRWQGDDGDKGYVSWQGSQNSDSNYGKGTDTACCKGNPVQCETSTLACGGGGTAHDLGFSLTVQSAYCDSTQQCVSADN